MRCASWFPDCMGRCGKNGGTTGFGSVSVLPLADGVKSRAMGPKKLAEYWVTIGALTGTKPVWWKRVYMAIVFRFSPLHIK
jgi:hypothetical protein